MENSKTILVTYKGREAVVEQLPSGKWWCKNIGQFTTQGSSVTWLDDARIPLSKVEPNATWRASDSEQTSGASFKGGSFGEQNAKGRFPANLIVSDDALNDGKERKSGQLKPGHKQGTGAFGKIGGELITRNYGGDSGSFSRFFSLDAWWTERLKSLPESVQKTFPFLVVAKASKREKNEGLDRTAIVSIESDIWANEGKKVVLQVAMEASQIRVTGASTTPQESVIQWSTLLFGNPSTEKFQKASASIMSITTNSTIASKISNWLTHSFTNDFMAVVNSEKTDGGSHAESAESSNILITTINEQMAEALGVKSVASGTPLKISVSEGRCGHPTCKPLTLMSYLVTLGSRRGDTVLDPFLGSGTTACAAKMLGRNWIGIEREAEYIEIARARINAVSDPLL